MATQRQIKAAENIVENRGNVSKAMLDAGYTPASAKNPKNLTESKGFQTITEELHHELGSIQITPKKLARVIKQGLSAKQPGKMIIIDKAKPNKDGTPRVTTKTYQAVDHNTRHKFLDTSLKILGAYPKEDKSPTALILAQFKVMASDYALPEPPIEGTVVHDS